MTQSLEDLKKKARDDMATHREQGIANGHGLNAYSPEQYKWIDTLIEQVYHAKHVPPHAMDLEDSVWLKRLLNKAFNHSENI